MEVKEDIPKRSWKDGCVEWISRIITVHPLKFLIGTLTILLLMTIIGAAVGAFGLSDYSDYDWVIASGRAAEDYEAYQTASGMTEKGNATQNSDFVGKELLVLYETDDDASIFTPENVQTMCQIEQMFLNTPDYNTVCLRNDTGSSCANSYFAVSHVFYGNGPSSCGLLSSGTVSTLATSLYNSLNTTEGRLLNGFFMDANTMDRSGWYSTKTRSRIPMGAPLSGYASQRSDIEAQDKLYSAFYEKVHDRYFDFFGMKDEWMISGYRTIVKKGDLKIRFYSGPLTNIELNTMVEGDLTLAGFSIIFVFSWMWYHLGSFFMATMGMVQIILSIPVTIFIYALIYQVPYFTQLHTLTIFLVLGIGADDVFVFVDGWRQAGVIMEERRIDDRALYLHGRMTIAYKRTLEAVFDTSFTTMVAFLATAISPIMPVATFGIFAATAILVNYIFVITFIPAAVVVQTVYLEKSCCQNQGSVQDEPEAAKSHKLEETKASDPDPTTAGLKTTLKESTMGDDFKGDTAGDFKDLATEAEKKGSITRMGEAAPLRSSEGSEGEAEGQESSPEHDDDAPVTRIDWLFHKFYIPFMKREKNGYFYVAIILFLAFLGYGIMSMVYASQLSPPSKLEQWFPSDHMFTGIMEDSQNDYMAGELSQYVTVVVPFGITGIARPDYNQYTPAKNRGYPTFDASFDLHPAASQDAFLSACNLATNYACDVDGCQEGKLVWPKTGALLCFLSDFQSWFAQQSRNAGYSTYNCTSTRFYEELKTYRNTSTSTVYNTDVKQSLIGFIDGELKFAAIKMHTTLESISAVLQQEKVRKVVDAYASDVNSNSPSGMNTVFGASEIFMILELNLGLVEGFFRGMMICFPMAFVMLLISTRNFILSLYATISIGLIVSCVLGMCKIFLDWDLGTAEAIAGIIVIGFSVDYVIHLGHMYVVAAHQGTRDRVGRFTFSAKKMAGTVFAGAMTTFGAGLPLFACQLTFFNKMGTLMSGTIAFSICYAMGFFMSALLLIGPIGEVGDLKWVAEKTGLQSCCEKMELCTEEERKEGAGKEVDVERPTKPSAVVKVDPKAMVTNAKVGL